MIITLIYANNSDLQLALSKVAGIYRNPKQYREDLNRTVLITGCNHGFLNHLLNFLYENCFIHESITSLINNTTFIQVSRDN